MELKIKYFKNPREYLESFHLEDVINNILETKKYFDYAGGVVFPTKQLEYKLSSFPKSISSTLRELSNKKGGFTYLRSKRYYLNFLFKGDVYEHIKMSEELIMAFKNSISMPNPTPSSLTLPFGESSARKLIIREMDHPMQIIFFAGQLLNQDIGGLIDFVVNPLSGGLEIGYGLKSIYETFGTEKIKDILLIKYSRYGDGSIVQPSLNEFIPKQIKYQLKNITNKRLLIVDDNTFSGETLCDLKGMCSVYTNKVGIAAIEKRMDQKDEQLLSINDFDIEPISKLRYIGRIVDFIKNNNLYGLL